MSPTAPLFAMTNLRISEGLIVILPFATLLPGISGIGYAVSTFVSEQACTVSLQYISPQSRTERRCFSVGIKGDI